MHRAQDALDDTDCLRADNAHSLNNQGDFYATKDIMPVSDIFVPTLLFRLALRGDGWPA
jgi:hypothetical protein